MATLLSRPGWRALARRWPAGSLRLGLAVTVALAAAGCTASSAGSRPTRPATSASRCPWTGKGLTIAARVGELLRKMTLADKAAVLGLANQDGYENATTPVGRLCIPALVLNDGPAGIIAGGPGSHTQLPSPIGIAASWDSLTASGYGTVLGSEAVAKGINVVQGPDIDIDRVPQDGRAFESLGEDPYLTSQFGVDIEKGIEGAGAASMPKHFTVYNQETYRDTPQDNVFVSQRALQEIYLPAFGHSVADGHVSSVMCSYASLAGVEACEDPALLITILRDQFGFAGLVRSDEDAVPPGRTAAAVTAGTDQLKPIPQGYPGLLAKVPAARLNQAVSDVLTQMFTLGLIKDPAPSLSACNAAAPENACSDASTPAHIAFARLAAEQGTVLLKNAGPLLPLRAGRAQSIAVIGPDGSTGALTASPAPSADHVSSSAVVTPLNGIRATAPRGTSVAYDAGFGSGDAAAIAKANAALVFADVPEHEGKDLTGLSLPGQQDQLIEDVAKDNPDTVVVINSATPVLMPWLGQVKSVLEAWYPGQQDGYAIAGILFGEFDPGGKLPVTFPASQTQTPVSSPSQFPGQDGAVEYSEGLDVGYRWYDAHNVTALFPFGYGLSYTTFSFSQLSVTPGTANSLRTFQVTATVTNTGHDIGSEVAQLYLGYPAAAGEPPRQLKGFQRVVLQPGQSQRVQFTVTPDDLGYYDTTAQAWTVADGTYQVYVGDSSALPALPLRGAFRVNGTTGPRAVTVHGPATVQAGRTAKVTTVLTGGGDLTLHSARVALAAPAGWTVKALGPVSAATLGPSRALTVTWQVTVPAGAVASVCQLAATASFRVPGGASGTEKSWAELTVNPP